MTHLILLLLKYLVLLWVTVDSIDYAEEGSTFNFTYQGFTHNMSCDIMTWSRRQFTMIIQTCNRTSYNGSYSTYSCRQQPGTREVSSTVTADRGLTSTSLIIRNVSSDKSYSDEGSWDLFCDAPEWVSVISFEMKLFAKSSNTACTTDFLPSGLYLTCKTEKVYQQNMFYVKATLNKTLLADNFPLVCHYVQEASSQYNSSVCTYVIPPGSLKAGRVDVNMTVYPNLTNTVKDQAFGASRLLTFYIENPRTFLTHCADRELDEGENFTCTCQRSDHSDIPTNVIWLVNGTEQVTSSNGSAFLTTTATRYKANYSCAAMNSFGWQSNSIPYQVSVLYPPTDITISIKEDGTHFTVTCRSTGNPEPLLSLARDGARLVLPTESNFTLEWSKSWSCGDGGVYVCGARNNKGSSEKSQTVFIKCETSCTDVMSGVDTVAIGVGVAAAITITILLAVLVLVIRRKGDLPSSSELKTSNTNVNNHESTKECLSRKVVKSKDSHVSCTNPGDYVTCLDYGFCDNVDQAEENEQHVYQEFEASGQDTRQ